MVKQKTRGCYGKRRGGKRRQYCSVMMRHGITGRKVGVTKTDFLCKEEEYGTKGRYLERDGVCWDGMGGGGSTVRWSD